MRDKPNWLVVRAPTPDILENMENLFESLSIETVCKNAHCPNLGECFREKTATFMILGNVCTRECKFCAVEKGLPLDVDLQEPFHLATAVNQLGLKHVVITSVTRDDLPDQGSGHYAKVIDAIRTLTNQTTIEVLIPDFQGSIESLKNVIYVKPDILNHNVETVPRLYQDVRPQASFSRSLNVLHEAKQLDPDIITKSGIMVGLGEKEQELTEVFEELLKVGCDILTIGQYLQPSKKHIPVSEYITNEIFGMYKSKALEMGFKYVASGPFVRSSYKAFEGMNALRSK